ncbi:hypothetical protein MMC17_003995 [Xylographa soralifera]|nr:hypothetical protein [Xylographa soralifera]
MSPPSHPVFHPGATALITGAASGIGLAVARLCSTHGMKLALVDNNASSLARAQSSLQETATAEVATYEMDVSQLADWQTLKSAVEQRFGGVDFLMLNAGVGVHGGWEDVEYFHKAAVEQEQQERSTPLVTGGGGLKLTLPPQILDTNLYGAIHGVATLLPLLSPAPAPTAIVLTGSKQGITNPPGNVAYNMSKAALKTLAEHLSYDLRATATSVHLLIPGWTYTGLTGGTHAAEKPAGAWAPEQVAGFLEKKMAEGVFYVLCPDNDVSVDTDRRRMLWAVGDVVMERPPLSRWREEWRERAVEGMRAMKGEGLVEGE